jgi:prevent-host-death family protein
MKTTVTAAEAKTQFSHLLRQVEAGETIAISKRDETVAFLIPRARLEALVETMEVLGNPAAMEAIRLHEAGNLSFHPLSTLDEHEVKLRRR